MCSEYTGDTFLRASINGIQVSSNDDFCDYGSQMSFTLSVGQTVVISEGCYEETSCTGTVTLTFMNVVLLGGNPTMTPTISQAPTPVLQPTSNQFPLNLTCTGRPQLVSVPTGVSQLSISAFGAQGSESGGLGGYISCSVPVTAGTVLTVYVGCAGATGGYPDGGWSETSTTGGGVGGGSSSVRSSLPLVVAGAGGGGFISTGSQGGKGGGLIAGQGQGGCGAGGGSQSAGGSPNVYGGQPGSLSKGGSGALYGIYTGGGGTIFVLLQIFLSLLMNITTRGRRILWRRWCWR